MGGQSLKESWIVVMTAAMFFFYEFIQGNMFNSIAPDIMSEFGLGATRLGWLTGTYFIANMIFLIPAGYLLDHYSTRKIILSTINEASINAFQFLLMPNNQDFSHNFSHNRSQLKNILSAVSYFIKESTMPRNGLPA